MSGRPSSFMPFYVGDYLRDTLRLTRAEHGGYMLLLMAYWAEGKPLADDDRQLAAIVRATAAEWRKLRVTLAAFFDIRDGAWHHKRVEHELKKANEAYERRKQAGARGNASVKRRDAWRLGDPLSEGNADALRAQPEPQPQDLSPKSSSRRGSRARGALARAALPALPAGPDWSETASEDWRAFKAMLGPSDWRIWFAPCRLGEEATLIAPSRFSAEKISEKFGAALTAHFGAMTVTSQDRKAPAGEQS
jgi:uncharacterized protein YdaU (DUF1376 family)